jgi:hypothetical protein
LSQPRVAGEILGGLLLGPTVLGLVAPGWQQALFHDGKATQAGLGIFYQLGLLLMYCSGAELRSILSRRDGKATAGIAALGNAVPFLAGLGFLKLYDTDRFLGPAGNRTAFVLVFALAMAVTSIPVISRIMTDLGIMGTRFARIVLSVAVLEDLLVYVVLNLAWPWWRRPTPTPPTCPSCSACSPRAPSATPTTWPSPLPSSPWRRCSGPGPCSGWPASAATCCTAPARSPSSWCCCWR